MASTSASPVVSSSPTNSSRNSRRSDLDGPGVPGEQRPLDHLGEVHQGEHRPVEVGEVPPQHLTLLVGELLCGVDGGRGGAGHGRQPIAGGRTGSPLPVSEPGRAQESMTVRGQGLGAVEHRGVARRAAGVVRRTPGCGSRPRRGHGDHRVDGGHLVAHVAHVGAARPPGPHPAGPGAARGPRSWRRSGQQPVVVDACRRRPGRATRGSSWPRWRSPRPAVRRGPAAFRASRSSMVAARTYQCMAAWAGHDVGLVPAVGEHAVDPLARADVLAQRGDGHVAEHRRVERVARPCGARPRRGRPRRGTPRAAAGWRCSPSSTRSWSAGWTIIAARRRRRGPRRGP